MVLMLLLGFRCGPAACGRLLFGSCVARALVSLPIANMMVRSGSGHVATGDASIVLDSDGGLGTFLVHLVLHENCLGLYS